MRAQGKDMEKKANNREKWASLIKDATVLRELKAKE
jgi:hypothetical protein